jgi:hypothetical protein
MLKKESSNAADAAVAQEKLDFEYVLKSLKFRKTLSLVPKHPAWLFPLDEKVSTKVNDTKYFFENSVSRHLDVRHSKINRSIPLDFQAYLLRDLVHAWHQFSLDHKIVSWLAHGTLLSWFWNQKLFPWDTDLDFQMSYADVETLAKFNSTLYKSRYLIDVNPNFRYRYLQMHNTIDARFIDTEHGVLLDITVLSTNENGTLHCKSPHFYNYTDLFPLSDTIFEGKRFFRPRNTIGILQKEYGELSMIYTTFKNFSWDPLQQKWLYASK